MHSKRLRSAGFATLVCVSVGTGAHIAAQPAGRAPAATTRLLASMDLEGEIPALAGKSLRTRLVTIRPGGKLAEHSHADRPSVMYLTEGRIIEHRRGYSQEYVAGDTFTIGQQVPHWSENPGTVPASYVEVDLFTQAAVPITQEPRHRVVFEQGTTRIHDVQIPPGDTSLYHVHDSAILYVPISRSRTRSQVLGAEWSGGDAAASVSAPPPAAAAPPADGPGRVSSIVNYLEKPVTHRVNNVGDGLFRLIAVVNQSAGSESESDDVSGMSGKPEVLNRFYRARRVTLRAGESTPAHRHGSAVVVVQQTAGKVTVEGGTRAETGAAGAFAYGDGSGEHTLRNAGDAAVELIEVELRGSK